MYKCDVCKAVSGGSRKVHIIYRPVKANGPHPARLEIEREIPVCGTCKGALDSGVTLLQLREAVYLSSKLREAREEAKARSVTIMMVPIDLAPKEVKKPKVKSVGLIPVEVKTGDKPWKKPKTKKQRVVAAGGGVKPKGVKQPGQRQSRKSSG